MRRIKLLFRKLDHYASFIKNEAHESSNWQHPEVWDRLLPHYIQSYKLQRCN